MALWKDSNNGIHDDMDGAALSLPTWPQGMTQITQSEADAILNPPLTSAQLHAQLVASAKVALDSSDMVAIRCMKAGVAFPGAWQTYVTGLRAIVNGTDTTSTVLPTQPAYPAGT